MSKGEGFQYAIPEIFESVEDAAREAVRALGGTKKVGPMLWPAKEHGEAQRHLNDCLNSDRPQKLAPQELITLARWGKEVGCHALAVFFNERAGYAPPLPIAPADEKAELERKTIEAVGYMRHLVERAEAVYGKK